MKEIFEELEAEDDQNVMNRKHDEIERKNILIANDNLISDCLSREVTLSDLEENEKVKKHYKELYDSIKITRAKHIKQITALLTDNENLKAQIHENLKCITMDSVKPRVLATGRYQRKNQLYQAVPSSIPTPPENKVVQIVLWYLDAGCLKHMKKFTGTVRFGNDQFGTIIGYGDYMISDSVISRVYYMERLGHNLFSVRQFCDSDLEVAFRKHSCYVRDTDGVELIKGSRGSNLYTISVEYMMKSSPICLLSKASKNKSWLWHRRLNHLNFGTIKCLLQKGFRKRLYLIEFENIIYAQQGQLGIFHQKSVPRTPQQNGVVERQNCTLVEAARTMLIFSKALMFLWEEAVAIAFFGALCYLTNDSEDLGKLQPTTDIGIFI
ncbi:integrase, catalytic region, zinc finger, CCHC-type containing protein, partial [Tanacetum coccineum]